MAQAVDPSAKLEADALLIVLGMAERHQRWGLMAHLLAYMKEAEARFSYLGPGSYALELPPHETPKDPQ